MPLAQAFDTAKQVHIKERIKAAKNGWKAVLPARFNADSAIRHSSLPPSALQMGSPFVIFSRYSTTIGMEKLPSGARQESLL
jgi:hypothetical protein